MGKMTWTPKPVLTELDDLMKEKRIKKKSQAFLELTNYARIGRETERLLKFDFKHKPTPNFMINQTRRVKRNKRLL